ncbi:hypothetical protein HOP52_16155 [Halomonas campisalis]|uniref:Uncharacterized protein n=1 Tax=Billgrantia campisalis TaxID=74661 RepID=A0ABS9PC11_9GAMM|nr:hypothetical protein [Halomonas campisalis]MCG6659292.1 hypothetical protein [Halomonas campisalis]MDR5864291.1 hypothetical protein [Halomonas campisalis]
MAQEIGGSDNQVAGRDFYNQVQEHVPPVDSPYLQNCKACGWHGVAVNAAQCGKCGYDYALERAIAVERERKDRERLVLSSIYGLGTMVGIAAWTSSRTSLGFLDAVAVCGFAAVFAWGGWIWLRACCSVKWQALKRRWRD